MTFSESAQVNPSETPEITFFNLATLTYDLDHRTPPRYTQGQSPYQIIGPYVKRFCSWERQLTDRRTHTQTHGTDFIPSTADAGGNNNHSLFLVSEWSWWIMIWLPCYLRFSPLKQNRKKVATKFSTIYKKIICLILLISQKVGGSSIGGALLN